MPHKLKTLQCLLHGGTSCTMTDTTNRKDQIWNSYRKVWLLGDDIDTDIIIPTE